jgi:hypothetical protein
MVNLRYLVSKYCLSNCWSGGEIQQGIQVCNWHFSTKSLLWLGESQPRVSPCWTYCIAKLFCKFKLPKSTPDWSFVLLLYNSVVISTLPVFAIYLILKRSVLFCEWLKFDCCLSNFLLLCFFVLKFNISDRWYVDKSKW